MWDYLHFFSDCGLNGPTEKGAEGPSTFENRQGASVTLLAAPESIDFKTDWAELELPAHVMEVLSAAPAIYVPERREDLLDWALGREAGTTDWRHSNREDKGVFESAFDVPGIGRLV